MSLAAFFKTPESGNQNVAKTKTRDPFTTKNPKIPYSQKPMFMKKLFLLMLSIFACCAADAQVTTSGMNGTVTDIDGQPGPRFPVRIACEPGALRVICPQKKPKK